MAIRRPASRQVRRAWHELDADEADTGGVRRIVRKRISRAHDALKAGRLTDEAVHEARKELKKARAGLRLLRGAIPDATYKRENAALRDVARPLSEVRDGKALLNALDGLTRRYGAAATALPLDRLRRSLRRERAEARRRTLNPASLAAQRAALKKSRERADRWRAGHHGWKVIGSGLERTYTQGRKAFSAARADATVAKLHEWRKQAKYLRYELEILHALWPGLIGELVDQMHELTNDLGDDHDLAALRDKVLANDEIIPGEAKPSAFVALVDRHRTELQARAFALGARIYEEKPKAFAARFENYWEDWRRQAATAA